MSNSILSSTGPPKLIVDSGSRGTYVSISCPVVNKQLTNNPKHIQIPDGKIMTSTHEAELDYPELRPAARAVDIVPALHDYSLLLVGKLCDADYHVIFDKHEVRVMDNDLLIMRGARHATTGLWHMDTQSPRSKPNQSTPPASASTSPIAHAHAAIGGICTCYTFLTNTQHLGESLTEWILNQFPWVNHQSPPEPSAASGPNDQRPPRPKSQEPALHQDVRCQHHFRNKR
jgi:hypothetical protein